MVTVDRAPRENYLHYTLDGLDVSGVFQSDRLESFHIVDSGSAQADDWRLHWPYRAFTAFNERYSVGYAWPNEGWSGTEHLTVHESTERISGKQNTARALRVGGRAYDGAIGSNAQPGWVLFMEDDLAFCADFLDSVGRWLDKYEGDDLTLPKRPIYPFSGDHAHIRRSVAAGEFSWEYPVKWFWGLQCFACRPDVALDLAQWLEDHPIYFHTDGRPDANAHDLEMHNWARERDYEFFRGSCPSFVQHIGVETSIAGNAMGGAKVTFPTWPGPEWSFR